MTLSSRDRGSDHTISFCRRVSFVTFFSERDVGAMLEGLLSVAIWLEVMLEFKAFLCATIWFAVSLLATVVSHLHLHLYLLLWAAILEGSCVSRYRVRGQDTQTASSMGFVNVCLHRWLMWATISEKLRWSPS